MSRRWDFPGRSLFSPLPADRDCAAAGISADYCFCQSWQPSADLPAVSGPARAVRAWHRASCRWTVAVLAASTVAASELSVLAACGCRCLPPDCLCVACLSSVCWASDAPWIAALPRALQATLDLLLSRAIDAVNAKARRSLAALLSSARRAFVADRVLGDESCALCCAARW